MKKILDALLWASTGSMLTFYVLMQGMSEILSSDENGSAVTHLASAREQFWIIWSWALGAALLIAVADIFVRWRSREVSR